MMTHPGTNADAGSMLLRMLSLVGGFHWLTAAVLRNQSTLAPSSAMDNLCAGNVCGHGQCYVVGNRPRCVCDRIYRGKMCQVVNLDTLEYAIIGRVVFFQWQEAPQLQGYSFVYYRNDHPEVVLLKPIVMRKSQMSLIVAGLKGVRTSYTICIEDQTTANTVKETGALDVLSNCLEISTKQDYQTLVAWVISCTLFCVVVFLIYHQKEKIEFMYFNKPPIPWRKSSKDMSDHDPLKLPDNGTVVFPDKEQTS